MRAPLSLALAVSLFQGLPIAAQERIGPLPDRSATYWAIDVGAAVSSALLQSHGTEHRVLRVLAAGLAGGTLIYAGQRVIGSHDPRLRLPGLQLAAVGASISGNIARGRRPWSDLTLPLFPFYLRVRTEPAVSVRVRLSTMAVVSGIRMAATYHQAPDLLRSLESGAPVFAVPRERLQCCEYSGGSCTVELAGQHVFGAVAYATDGHACLCHEFGHVAQDIRDAVLFAVPLSDLLLSRTGSVGRWLDRYLVLDGALPLMLLNNTVGDRRLGCGSGSFYECEVNRLSH